MRPCRCSFARSKRCDDLIPHARREIPGLATVVRGIHVHAYPPGGSAARRRAGHRRDLRRQAARDRLEPARLWHGRRAERARVRGMNAQLYANTADPRPALSTHGPTGKRLRGSATPLQTPVPTPRSAPMTTAGTQPRTAIKDAVNGYLSLGWASPARRARPWRTPGGSTSSRPTAGPPNQIQRAGAPG